MAILYLGTPEKESVSAAALSAANLIAALSPDARVIITVDRGAFGEFTLMLYPEKE